MLCRLTVLVAIVLVSPCLTAEVHLPHVLSDHAVLQRDRPVRVWGWAAPSEEVTVAFHHQTLNTKADGWGEWEVWLRPEEAGGPYNLTVSGSDTVTPLERTDILVGEVWIASGQSNMEMPLAGFGTAAPLRDSAKEIAAADHPKIRLLLQQHRITDTPQADSNDSWKVCTPESATKFSAAAYFFAREIQQREGDIPVGVIDTSFGGTPAQSWISSEGIAWANLPSIAYEAGAVVRNTGRATGLRQQYAAEDAEARAVGKPVPTHPRLPGGGAEQSIPSTLYNGMVQPYVNYSIRGVIWYQGESDTSTPSLAANYSRVFPALITDWRKQWGEGEFPFIFVQIAGEDGAVTWGVVRDTQRRSLALTNTGMAVILDAAEAKNIHPADKQIVGARLAQIALGMVYGKKVETASPLFVQATTEDNAIRAWFSHADGLRASDKTIGDFEVAGEDHHFVPATAVIERIGTMETVLAHADAVPLPRYIRYGWTPYVKSYLYNAGGLPMSTFTSESDAQMVAR